jgi:UPF0755 protein
LNQNDVKRVPDAVVSKKRRSAFARVLGSYLVMSFLFGLVALVGGLWGWSEFTAPGPLSQAKTYQIPRGLSRSEISQALKEQGIIANSLVFTAASYADGLMGGRIKAGEYAFPESATMGQVLGIITSGKVITYKLLIPEGWTSDMALARVNANDVLTGDPATAAPEGAIMPDTYVFQRGLTRAKMVEDMQAAQAKMLDEVWAKRPADTILKTKEEAVVLASIVEKETGVAEERPLVASVFINRLKKGMRLQSDPTIIYGLVGGKGKLDRELTRTDIDSKTPYNTYVIDGLPPGPIANPGRAAIEAVLNPAKTDFLYFVADGTGGHAFAATLEEHNANVAKWRALGNAPVPATTSGEAPAPGEGGDAAQTVVTTTLPTPPEEQVIQPAPISASAPPVTTAPAKAAAAAPAEKAVEDLKPGSLVTVNGKLVPIPKRKPKK